MTADFFETEHQPPPKPQAKYPLYASVAVNEPVDALFEYGVPGRLAGELRPGSLVQVPFGGRRRTHGCVVELSEHPGGEVDDAKIRAIDQHIVPEFYVDAKLVALGRWISDYYLSPQGETLGCVSFIGYNPVGQKGALYYRVAKASDDDSEVKITERQARVLDYLRAAPDGSASAVALRAGANATPAVLKTMLRRDLIEAHYVRHARPDDYGPLPPRDTPLELTHMQQNALDTISSALIAGEPATFLLHGVTGSGKTEIYLQLIAQVLEAGGQTIVLVPEISLTPQAVARFRSRFGETVGVYHSRLTLPQKFDFWRRIKSGDCRVMIGARSAVFTPFHANKLIIIDEEHESSYKQDSTPRYHARDVAIMRAQSEGAVVVLGSATPSVESYYKAQTGKFQLLTLPDRISPHPLPQVRVIDMTAEARDEQNPEILSRPMRAAMREALERGEQCLVLLNRRGFFNFLVCLTCKAVVKCKQCDVALTHHRPKDVLICHCCERRYVMPKVCPACESEELSLIGLGTQRVEEILRETFPQARTVRVDLDTTRQRTAFIDAWRKIEQGEVDIILGTQMIAKGFHIENVTVVGVPLADVSLFQPDFRCAERAFSLLTQVAGRAGRGEKPGNVYVQTYVPYHYAVVYARTHDFAGFFQKEIRVREVLRFPPFFRIASVTGTGKDQEKTAELFADFSRLVKDSAFRTDGQVIALGPAPAPISKIKDEYRWRLLLRSKDHRAIKDVLHAALERYRELPRHTRMTLTVDIDPLDLL